MTEEGRFHILDRPEVARVLFHPRPDPPDRPVPLRVRSVRIPVDEGIAIGGRLHRAKLDGPNLLLFHGNGELASDYDGISLLFTSLGINLLIVDYRGYGNSDGEPAASNLLSDAIKICDQTGPLMVEHELKPRPLFVMGRSLGSAAAIEIARHAGNQIDGLIVESGFALTLPLLVTLGLRLAPPSGGLRLEVPETVEAKDPAARPDQEGFGNLEKIAQVRVPTLIIHGQEDQLIPVENAQALYEHAGASDKRLVTIPNAGHNDLLFTGQRPYLNALRAFIFPR